MDALLERRLDRLRVSSRDAGTDRQPPADHSASLAIGLGGSARRTASGSIVVFQEELELPLAVHRLMALPYSIDATAPLVCLDLETTGLATAAGTLPFLVGIGVWRAGKLTLTQLLLPDHAGERALLDAVDELLSPHAWLVTYNGKCFDWPLMVARYRLHRRGPPVFAGHLDLLPVARQLWKHRLGGARLAIVEEAMCGVVRRDDLPGHLIPERYFAYLRSRQAEMLRPIVEHNRQDIVSLARLLGTLADGAADPQSWPSAHPGDLFGLARAYARRRRPAEALRVAEAALGSSGWSRGIEGGAVLHRRLSAERARLLGRLGRRREAYEAWLEICARGGPGAGLAWLHVARYREHVTRDIAGALEACREAGAIADRARAWGEPMSAVELDLSRRLPRLRRLSFRRRPLSPGVGRAA